MASSGSDSSDSDSDGPLPGVVVSDNEDDALPPQAGFTEEEFDVAVKVGRLSWLTGPTSSGWLSRDLVAHLGDDTLGGVTSGSV